MTAETVKSVLFANVEPTAKLYTDEGTVYCWASKPWEGGHETVNHSAGEYVRGTATTNSIEGFFSLLKRGIYGTFHSASKKRPSGGWPKEPISKRKRSQVASTRASGIDKR